MKKRPLRSRTHTTTSDPQSSTLPFRRTRLAAAVSLLGLGLGSAQAATLVVDTPLDAVAFDGFCSLREAVIVVNTQATAVNVGVGAPAAFANGECLTEFDPVDPTDPFDTINLPAGTFALTLPGVPGDGANSGDLLLTRSVVIDGAGPASTIITAGGDGPNSINNRVFDIQAANGEVTLSDLTVTGGRLAAGAPNGNNAAGIGVFAAGANVVLDNIRITDNHTQPVPGSDEAVGGGLRVLQAASVTLRNGTRIDNNSALVGGGVHAEPTALVVNIEGASIDSNSAVFCGGLRLAGPLTNLGTGTVVSDNSAENNGGGACVSGQTDGQPHTANLVGVTFGDNTAGIDGGGLHVAAGAAVNIAGASLFQGNAATNASGGGVVIDNNSTAQIDGSTVRDNTAGQAGGGMFVRNGSTVTITGSTVSGNLSRDNNSGGGGIRVDNATLTLTRSLIGGDSASTGNTAEFGGAISAVSGATVNLVNTTVSGNRANVAGGGFDFGGSTLSLFSSTVTANVAPDISGLAFFGADQALTVNNSIVSGNNGADDCGIGGGTDLSTNGFNVLDTAGCEFLATIAPAGTANTVTTDAGLAALADNGGPTLTHASLAFDGAAVDGGDPAGCIDADGNVLTTDQRGAPRPQDGDRDGTPRCDLGAFELGGNSPPVAADDTATVAEDTSGVLLADLTANDVDPDGDALSVTAVRNFSAGGSASLGNGMVSYTPAADFNGTETFDYDVSDGFGGMDSATVTVTVTPQNDSVVAANDSATVDEDSSANPLEVLANDVDPDGDLLTISAVGTPGDGGTVTRNGDNTALLYTPAANFAGTETFTYTASDGQTQSMATVTVTVVDDNDPNDNPEPEPQPEPEPAPGGGGGGGGGSIGLGLLGLMGALRLLRRRRPRG